MTATKVRWITPAEAAELAMCHVDTVRLRLRSGEWHGHQRTRNGLWWVHPAAPESWVRGGDGKAECGCVAPIRLAKRRTA